MMDRRLISLIVGGVLVGGLVAGALAQDPNQPGQPGGQGGFSRRGMRRGFGGPGGQFGPGGPGGQFLPGGFGMQGGQNDRNPLVSHEMELINRPDVQNEIHLDLKQKTALQQFQGQAQTAMRQQMQQFFQNQRGQFGPGGGQPGAPGGDPAAGQADRAAQRQQFGQQMQAQRSAIQSKINAGLKEILRPDQAQRLHELDLQWRGVLSNADSKVAEETKISQEHRTAISNLYNEYQNKNREAMQQLFQSFRANRQPGAAPGGQNLQGQFAEIARANETARKEAEDKALAVLSAEEKSNWSSVTGKPFTFRKDIQTPRPQVGGA